jgi:hypothetical protein
LKLIHVLCNYISSLGGVIYADDVNGKPYQSNDNEYRDQKGRRNPHRDVHSKSPFQR